MVIRIDDQTVDVEFVEKVQEISGQSLHVCMQCGTCSASCPMVESMELTPRRVMQLLHMGLREHVENVNTVWMCASCHTCEARCPRGVELPKVMEAVRLLKLRRNQDHVDPRRVAVTVIREVPQVALVSAFRKLTA
jgi:heterodisulfide reductase subunit C